jgi:glutamine amidotransferase
LKIAIIDYGVGNIGSVLNAFSKIGANAKIESNPNKLKNYDKLFLPGVGAYQNAMDKLKKSNMDIKIKEFAKSGNYIIGMCLGMQIMLNKSYEFGEHKGLGLIDGEIIKFDKTKFNTKIKIPHMGWNILTNKQDNIFYSKKNVFKNIKNPYLYFVHSYHAICDDKYVLAKSNYGYEFVSAIKKDNIYGFQPHLEKSSNAGISILNNFVNLK